METRLTSTMCSRTYSSSQCIQLSRPLNRIRGTLCQRSAWTSQHNAIMKEEFISLYDNVSYVYIDEDVSGQLDLQRVGVRQDAWPLPGQGVRGGKKSTGDSLEM